MIAKTVIIQSALFAVRKGIAHLTLNQVGFGSTPNTVIVIPCESPTMRKHGNPRLESSSMIQMVNKGNRLPVAPRLDYRHRAMITPKVGTHKPDATPILVMWKRIQTAMHLRDAGSFNTSPC